MPFKILGSVIMMLWLGACSTPAPPHCEDNGTKMRPINPVILNEDLTVYQYQFGKHY